MSTQIGAFSGQLTSSRCATKPSWVSEAVSTKQVANAKEVAGRRPARSLALARPFARSALLLQQVSGEPSEPTTAQGRTDHPITRA